MSRSRSLDPGRRSFLRVVPACAAMCLGGGLAAAQQPQPAAPPAQAPAPPARHPFDEEVPIKPTYRQLMMAVTFQSNILPFATYLSRTMGKEKAVAVLKAFADESSTRNAQQAAQRMGGSDFARLKQFFSPQAFKGRVVLEVAQSTDTVHELRVKECLWAKTWRDAGAGDEGYALICHGDYAFASGFNPKIEMTRDKTLMQGHDCCNHRYALKA